ncbi:MAG: transporter [Deltaproteobacteria bacterium RBG_13_65_10]|jgi:phospholipid/cholesterol/gamma-HCH transport system permease protein|nr:MAG: transporter [Deltaproteobacteria bacterium RBG_13_65_10]
MRALSTVSAVMDSGRRIAGAVGGVAVLSWETLLAAFSPPFELRELVRQVDEIGIKSLSIASITAIFTGMVLALQTAVGLTRFGAKLYVGSIVSMAMVRELGPTLTALILAGRVGSGITAELGSMAVTEQVDALRAIGANPVRKLVVPRVLACTVVMPLLAVLADFLGILGGMIIGTVELHVSRHFYLRTVQDTLVLSDVMSGIGKAPFFGFLIGAIACYNGLTTRGGTEGVGRATTNTVVAASIAILVTDFFLTKLFLLL